MTSRPPEKQLPAPKGLQAHTARLPLGSASPLATEHTAVNTTRMALRLFSVQPTQLCLAAVRAVWVPVTSLTLLQPEDPACTTPALWQERPSPSPLRW